MGKDKMLEMLTCINTWTARRRVAPLKPTPAPRLRTSRWRKWGITHLFGLASPPAVLAGALGGEAARDPDAGSEEVMEPTLRRCVAIFYSL